MNILFFGSTSDSVIVLQRLFDSRFTNDELRIAALVTQPPKPVGREHTITKTPVQLWGETHNVPVLSFPSNADKPWVYENEQTVIDTLQPFKADLIISACYGQMIPWETIERAPHRGLNVHPSILPRWRGADPVPWAIYAGDHQVGVSVVTLSKTFDDGKIIAQKKIPLKDTALPDPVRTELFTLGATLLVDNLASYVADKTMGTIQQIDKLTKQQFPYARRLTRDDGFEPWDKIQSAMLENAEEAIRIDRKFRAFTPWPGLWTRISLQGEERRLKILSCHMRSNNSTIQQIDKLTIETVQLEGKKPVSFEQFQKAYLKNT